MEPIRVLEGNAKPHEAFWRILNTVEGEEPEMELYGYISEYSWFDDDVTPKMFKDDLLRIGKGGPITVRMNSWGGDVIAASMMKSIMQEYAGTVTIKIDGIAASAATIVAMGGDSVKIQESAYFMIHDPAVAILAFLNIDDLSMLLDELKTVKKGIIDSYETKTKLTREKLAKMMSDTTWMTGQEAVDFGFADEVLKGGEKNLIKNAAFVNCLSRYAHVPVGLLPDPVQAEPAFHQAPVEPKIPAKPIEGNPPKDGGKDREQQRLRDYLDVFA